MTAGAPSRDVVVIGGGISGLVAAWRLRRAGLDVALLEAEHEPGGCIRTERRDGFLLEKGPFNVLVRDESFHELLEACAGEVALVRASEAAKARYVLRRGALHAVPTGPGGLVRTPLLGGAAKLRLVRGLLWSAPARTDAGGDGPSIFEAAERRFGRETAQTFVSALVAGIFGGDSRRLSLGACFPTVAQFDHDARSPLVHGIAAMRRRRREREAAGIPKRERLGLVSFDDGLAGLTGWLARQLGEHLHVGCPAASISRASDVYTVRCGTADQPRDVRARSLVLATPATASAALLAPIAPDASSLVAGIESASLVVVNLAFRRDQIAHPMSGYGFLVPESETRVPAMGVLWADSAFPHHAPATHRLLRVFMGGPRDPGAIDRDEPALLRQARSAVDDLLGITGEPAIVDVCRWRDAIPQYLAGHERRVAAIAETTAHLPRLHLIGNYLTGVSINDCVRDGSRAATAVAAELASERPSGAAATRSARETVVHGAPCA